MTPTNWWLGQPKRRRRRMPEGRNCRMAPGLSRIWRCNRGVYSFNHYHGNMGSIREGKSLKGNKFYLRRLRDKLNADLKNRLPPSTAPTNQRFTGEIEMGLILEPTIMEVWSVSSMYLREGVITVPTTKLIKVRVAIAWKLRWYV